jgi:MraZ protein
MSGMFTGEYNHTLDTKGRLIIPQKLREQLGAVVKVTRGLDGCLFLFNMDDWAEFEQKLRKLPFMSKNARQFMRFFTAGATDCELDKQGRVLLPATLREFACLDKEVVLAGMLNRIELWSKEKWTENNAFDNMDEIAATMAELGITM